MTRRSQCASSKSLLRVVSGWPGRIDVCLDPGSVHHRLGVCQILCHLGRGMTHGDHMHRTTLKQRTADKVIDRLRGRCPTIIGDQNLCNRSEPTRSDEHRLWLARTMRSRALRP
jgi:hypothetical protein